MCIRDRVTSEMDVQLTPISQVGEASTTENAETEKVTSISLHENKTDEMLTRLYNMMCSNFKDMNFKFDVQKSEIKEIQSSFNNKFDEQNDKMKINFNEMKNEIKRQNCHFDKRIDEMHTHFDKLTEQTVTLVDEIFDIPKSKVDENYKNKSGGSNDNTFTENSVSLSANKVSNNNINLKLCQLISYI